ncbi:MAG: beta-1,6-N-acetylglucosaminyltransferase [Methylococcales bacterium]|nr:beta-1,6-N-acetylglucosaminyltransferase [Methylococcales bacterium]
MRIAFGILSSNNTAAAIQQIIDAIGSEHTIIIHHDFSKQPDFSVTGDNVYVIENYLHTTWARWSLVEATLLLIETALARGEFDYFQLLSDTSLPIQPIPKFVDYLKETQPDASLDYVSLNDNLTVMMSHGYRAFTVMNSIRYKILRRLKFWYELDRTETQTIGGIFIRSTNSTRKPPMFWLQYAVMQLAARGIGFAHPFGRKLNCYAGSQWFGCSSAMCMKIMEWTKKNTQVVNHFKNMLIPDEFFFQTVILNLQPHNIVQSNHFVSAFDKEADYRGPAFMTIDDIEQLTLSGKFFARKFPKEPQHPLRLKVLNAIN